MVIPKAEATGVAAMEAAGEAEAAGADIMGIIMAAIMGAGEFTAVVEVIIMGISPLHSLAMATVIMLTETGAFHATQG